MPSTIGLLDRPPSAAPLNTDIRQAAMSSMVDEMPTPSEPADQSGRSLLRWLAIDLTPLRTSRDYRWLFAGQFVSSFGSAISYVVMPWQMYQLTRSSFAVGMLGVVEVVPMLLMAFVGGALADYIDRRRLILLAELGLTFCCAILVLNSLLVRPRAWVLLLIAALFAALSAIHRPALEALTPRLVDPKQLPAVSALSSLRYNFNFIIGPAIAGIIAASLGAAAAFTIDGPRGPKYVAKPGPVLLAKTTGAPMAAFYTAVEKAWVLNTWDQFVVPKPFSRVLLRASRLMFVPADADAAQMDEFHRELQATLERVTTFAESNVRKVGTAEFPIYREG